MLDSSHTRPEKKLIALLRWWTVLFTIAALTFIIIPDQLLAAIGKVGERIKWSGPLFGPSTERFWLVLTISLMVVLIVSAIKAQHDIIKNIFYVKIIIAAKFVSTIGFIYCLIIVQAAFAYLVGAVVDGTIFLITLYSYRRALASRS